MENKKCLHNFGKYDRRKKHMKDLDVDVIVLGKCLMAIRGMN